MPIRADLKRFYAGDWPTISLGIRKAAGWRCQGSPAYPTWRAANGEPHPVTGSKVVLTVAHLDQDPGNNDPPNLRALCQRCHNAHDQPHRQANAFRTRRGRRAMGDLFDGANPHAP